VFINTGSGANGSLRGLTQGVTAFVNVVGEVPGPVLLAGGALTALALGLPRGIIAWRAYQAQLTSVGLSMDAIALKSARTATALNALGGAVAVVGVAAVGEALIKVQAAAGVASVNVDALAQSLDQLNRGGQLSGGVADLFRESKGGLFGSDEKFVSTGEAIKRFSDIANDALGDDFYHKIVRLQDLGEGGAKFDKTIGQMDEALAQLVQSGHADQAAAALKTITSGIKDQGVVDEVTGKLTGYKDALKNIAPAAEDAVQPQSAMAAQLDKIDQSADDAKKALDNLRSAIEGLGSPLAAQRAAERDFQQAIDDSADRLKKRAQLEKELADAKAKPATSGRDNGPADANADGKISAAEARRKAARDKSESKADKEAAQRKAEDIARITAELDKYTKGFDVNTEAGRANQEALDNIRDATLKNVTATFDATGSTDKATEAMKRGRDAFIKAATAAGMAKDEAAKLADNLGLVPKDVTILVKQSGATAAQDAIDQAARDRTAIITVKTRIADFKAKQADEATSDPVPKPKIAKAHGGAIYGAGTGTSDSIHALLSNGEHVLTAAEVRKLGGQGAVYALRAAINQGRMPRFAQGGAVAGQFAPTRLSTPTSDGFGRGFLTGSLDLGDGLTGRIRAVAQSDEAARSRRGNRVSL
jgi:hypothetical protein